VKFPRNVAVPEKLETEWVSPPGRCVVLVITPVRLALNGT
jgi:hypothetical protein